MTHYIAKAFEEFYRAALVPAGVKPGTVQYIETRRAFYAGFVSANTFFTYEVASTEDTADEAAGCEMIGAVQEEIQMYLLSLKAGVV